MQSPPSVISFVSRTEALPGGTVTARFLNSEMWRKPAGPKSQLLCPCPKPGLQGLEGPALKPPRSALDQQISPSPPRLPNQAFHESSGTSRRAHNGVASWCGSRPPSARIGLLGSHEERELVVGSWPLRLWQEVRDAHTGHALGGCLGTGAHYKLLWPSLSSSGLGDDVQSGTINPWPIVLCGSGPRRYDSAYTLKKFNVETPGRLSQ